MTKLILDVDVNFYQDEVTVVYHHENEILACDETALWSPVEELCDPDNKQTSQWSLGELLHDTVMVTGDGKFHISHVSFDLVGNLLHV